MTNSPVYLDYNATTPIDPAVAEAMQPYLTGIFGNPSSAHSFGIAARQAVENARSQVAGYLHCQPDEIIFTSGGTESNNIALQGLAAGFRHKGRHLITSAIEHPAVLEVCKYLESQGFEVTYLPVSLQGVVELSAVEKALRPETILISIMHANNETGAIQPIRQIAQLARSRGILMHTDAAQSVGKIPVTIPLLQTDAISIAGHKLYAPKGIGALYLRRGLNLPRLMFGAAHENNRRPGTENVLEIVGLGAAFARLGQNDDAARLAGLRDHFETVLQNFYPQITINATETERLPNTSSISFPGLEANTIVAALEDVAVSAGAACHSETIEISHVLRAMQVPIRQAMGTIRFSLGRFTTEAEISRALESVRRVVGPLLHPQENKDRLESAETIRLTHFTHGLGCACKLRPQVLGQVLQKLPAIQDANCLVGPESADDATVYRISPDTLLVQTVDFFTPIVDDPFDFGRVAAANALSDIYAMGGKPDFALNIVAFPSNRLPVSVLGDILRGAQSIADEAGISVPGGHTIDDTEPKFGWVVTGRVSQDKLWRNGGARTGDRLVLTKAIGTGILSTALKNGAVSLQTEQVLVGQMTTLNRRPAEIAAAFEIHACTDISGFGLLGHLLEMLRASGKSAKINHLEIQVLPEVVASAGMGFIPGGTKDNYSFTRESTEYPQDLPEYWKYLLNDAQTSGGLLFSLPAAQAAEMLDKLSAENIPAAIIGVIEDGPAARVKIR